MIIIFYNSFGQVMQELRVPPNCMYSTAVPCGTVILTICRQEKGGDRMKKKGSKKKGGKRGSVKGGMR